MKPSKLFRAKIYCREGQDGESMSDELETRVDICEVCLCPLGKFGQCQYPCCRRFVDDDEAERIQAQAAPK